MSETLISKRLGVTKTELPPCCLRYVPNDNTILILGTYKLEDDGSRHGSLDIYKNDDGQLSFISKEPTASAILDIKFNPQDDSMLISAHSTGEIMVWKYDQENKSLEIKEIMQIFEREYLVTSIVFSITSPNILLATSTSGESSIVDLYSKTNETLFTTHELECWTGNFGELGELSNVVYTGGDDAKLIAHDLRTMDKIWSTTSRHHDAGVVSILPSGTSWNNANPHQLWSGSYDDNLRIFDLRLMDKSNPSLIPGYIPKILKQENLGGGVWRLIPSPIEGDERVLACCMYDGARVINPLADNGFEVSRYFKGDHSSMCYGGDWAEKTNTIATCSFYDNILQVWSPNEIE
ncbi:WD40-repeat-containing domain protein [Scheffersomyces coipomensis]|uniref:WD40-repeat-containing domain protein n=1 Tax=Scheffersomyces coipomensis TaxID=1788519 RepID=UPI00315CB987